MPSSETPPAGAWTFPDSRLRQDVQGLRGVAVLMVVLFHAGVPGLSGGFVGVDVFFVISGYLISSLLLKGVEQHGRIRLAEFFVRRAKRLLPAALVLLICVIAVTIWLYPPSEQREWLSAARAAAVYLSNFWLAGRALDYFASEAQGNPLLHTWSLAVEEQFYLVWPLILMLVIWRGGSVAVGLRRRLLSGVAAVGAASFIGCIWWTVRAQPWAFFTMPFRAWEFALGALVAFSGLGPLGRRAAVLCGWTGLIAVAGSAVGFTEDMAFPGFIAVLPAGGAALLLLGIRDHDRDVAASRLLGTWPLARLGDLSYSWYLWHWPVLVWTAALWPNASVWYTALAVAVSLGLAQASLRWVEDPVRHARFDGWRNRQVLALAIGASLLVAGGAWGLARVTIGSGKTDNLSRFESAVNDRPKLYGQGCHLQFLEAEPKLCAFGPADATRSVVLLGDSHAAQWFPALEVLALRNHWRLVTITKAACPALDLRTYNPVLHREYHECETWRDRAIARIKELRPALLVMASASYYDVDPAVRAEALARFSFRLRPNVETLVVVRDTPRPGFNVPSCLARAEWRGADGRATCTYGRESERVWYEGQMQAERTVLARHRGSYYVDLSRSLCSSERCEVVRGPLVLFSDAHHLTASFAATLAEPLQEALQDALGSSHPLFVNASINNVNSAPHARSEGSVGVTTDR